MNRIIYLVLLFCIITANSYAARTKYFFKEYYSEIHAVINNHGDTLFVNNSENIFETDSIRMEFITRTTFIEFTLTNKTKHAITINWDKIVYVDENNNSNNIVHRGVKYINKSANQGCTTIAPQSKINDVLQPVNNIYYLSGEFGGWMVNNLFPYYTKSIDDRNNWRDKYLGCVYSLYFPIIFNELSANYTISFKIKRITVEQHNPDMFIYLTFENNRFKDELK